ncbi:MAG TPA: hypothetical protein VIR63_05610 [Pontiella sp.]
MKITASILTAGIAACAIAQENPIDIDSTYFHPAASLYIHGETLSASNLVAQGLAQFPDNGKLLRLKELLEQQQEQNDQQQENQQQEDQQQQEQNDQQQQEQNDQQQEDQQDNPGQSNDSQQDQSAEQQEQQAPNAEQMTQDEAERLLDAMRQEEENKRLQLHPVMGHPVKVDKDW